MSQYFLDYLQGEKLITQQQSKTILELKDTAFAKNDLFYMYFYNLTLEQMNHAKEILQDSPHQSFEDAVKELGYINEDELGLYDESSELADITCAQMLIDSGMMSLEEILDELLNYKMDSLLGDNMIDLSEGDSKDTFIQEYLLIIKEGIQHSFDVEVTCGEVEILTSLQNEMFIFQTLKGDTDENCILTGISSDAAALQMMAEDLHGILTSGLDMPAFESTKEEVIDFFCETLNSINGPCTYKFDANFDLEIPFYQEQVILKAPEIYAANLTIFSYTIQVCMVHGITYNFEKAGL